MSTIIQKSPDDRLKSARIKILRNPTFCAFSGLLSCGEMRLDENLRPPTACTDGYNIRFHPGFIATLSDEQLRFVLLHEAIHIAYRHIGRYQHLWKVDARIANIAADYFVNLSLVDTDNGTGFITMPPVGVPPDPQFRGWTVERIFHHLMKNPPPQGGKGQAGQGEGDPDGMDSHEWESAEEVPEEVEAARATEIDRMLRQGQELAKRLRGKGEGNTPGVIADLLTPEVPWTDLLRDFVQETCAGRDASTWARPSRRHMSAGTYMPSMYSETCGGILIGLDTSGSCFGGETLVRFLTELNAVCEQVKPAWLRVVCWDYGIQSDQTFDTLDNFDWRQVKVAGGGGTDGSLLFKHMREKRIQPQVVINFTDGFVGHWGSCDVPTLWAVTEKGITAPWGRTIHITG
jgi:predicted metal-dependent peptidase